MALEEAIQHLKESLSDPTHKWGCEECKAEHEQLLEWLEDYKRLQSVSSWIPCSERMPEDNVNVLGNITITVNTNIAKPKQRTIFAKHDRVFGWTTANGYPIVGKITHWMPIPEPPKGERK